MKSAYISLENELTRCTTDELRLNNGSRFILRLRDDQKLRYFHKVFAPLAPKELISAEYVLGFALPESYKLFLTKCGGASLFDGTFHIFGYSINISRSLDLEDQVPLSISSAINDFENQHEDLFRSSWRPIGSVTLYDRVWVAICFDGRVRLLHSSHFLEFRSWTTALNYVISTMAKGMGCAPALEDGDLSLQTELLMGTGYCEE